MKDLRKEVRVLKAIQGIKYSEIAEYLKVKPSSFYCWLKGYYELSKQKEEQLKEIINNLNCESRS